MQKIHLAEIKKCEGNKPSWLKIVEYLIEYTNTKKYFGLNEIISKPKKLIEIFESKLKALYKEWWKENIKNDSKMEFYNLYKKELYFESYIDNLSMKRRKVIAKLRLSNHKFPIEKQRYSNIRRNERYCSICNSNEIGDENHYLLKCTNDNLEKLRNDFIKEITKILKEFKIMDKINIIKYCIKMSDPVIQNITAKFIEDIFINFESEENKLMK